MNARARSALDANLTVDESVLWWDVPCATAVAADFLFAAVLCPVLALISFLSGWGELSVVLLLLAVAAMVAATVLAARARLLTYVVTTHRVLRIARRLAKAPLVDEVAMSGVETVCRYRGRFGSVSFGLFTPTGVFQDGVRVPNFRVGELMAASARRFELIVNERIGQSRGSREQGAPSRR
jgi:hypothetical protein